MYWCKKEDVAIVIAVALLFLVTGMFFFNDFSSEGWLTGAAVSTIDEMGVPTEEVGEIDKVTIASEITYNKSTSSAGNFNNINLLGETSSNGIGVQDANSTSCGNVTGNLTLTANVNSSGTCFIINASGISLDCAGYLINFSSGGDTTYGIYNNGYANVTVKNCILYGINASATEKVGIYFQSASGGVIQNNTIYVGTILGYGIEIATANNFILNNTIYATGSNAYGIDVAGNSNHLSGNVLNTSNTGGYGLAILGHNNTFTNNSIITTGNQGDGFYLTNSDNNTLSSNLIITNGTSAHGIYLFNADQNLVYNNTVSITGATSTAIYLKSTSVNNLLGNNNLTSTNYYEMYDDTGDSYMNYLFYNNSFGEIRWVDSTNGSFPKNLTFDAPIASGTNVFVGNNTLAVNITAFSLNNSHVNSTVNLTFYQLNFTVVSQVLQLGNYSMNNSEIQASGTNCLGSGCTQLSWSGGTLIINSSSVGSFSAIGGTNNTAPNTTQLILNASSSRNATFDNLTCWAKGEDPEQTSLIAQWIWYNNSIEFSSGNTTISNGTLTNITVLASALTTAGENWTCSVRMNDGSANESEWNNASIVITDYICGDSVASSDSLRSNLTSCSGIGLNFTDNNLIFDCNNNVISGSGSNNGINLIAQNVTVKNCRINGFSRGIYVKSYPYNNLSGNTIYNNSYSGIYLNATTGNYITTNNIYNNTYAIYHRSSEQTQIAYNNITNNNYGVYIDENSYNNNITYNNLLNNSYSIYYPIIISLLPSKNNWWGTTDCNLISANISGWGTVDFSPILNSSYPGGSEFNCTLPHCGMVVSSSFNLSSNINNCSSNAVIFNADNNPTLDCKGYSISSLNNLNNGTGIYVLSSNNALIKNCLISQFRTGINIYSSSNVTIFNNTVSNTTDRGISSASSGGAILNNTISYNNGTRESYLSGGIYSGTATISGNYLTNNIPTGIVAVAASGSYQNNYVSGSTYGYSFSSISSSNFTSERIVNNTYGVVINFSETRKSYNNIFTNSTFLSNTFDMGIITGYNSNITSINNSINKSKIYVYSGGKVYVKWYVDVNVTNSTGGALAGVNVIGYNSLGEVDDSGSTDGTGVVRLALTELYRQNEINYYVTPGTITAQLGNYTQNSTSINLEDLTYASANLTLTKVSCGDTLTSDFEMGGDYNCPGSGLNLAGSNIIIDGNNYTLTGTGSGTGINLSGATNITIQNLRISNYSQGILLLNSNSSNINAITITNSSTAIVFNISNNNIVSSSTFTNNTLDVFAQNSGGTNNYFVNTSVNISKINISGTANVFTQKYVGVNVTYNNGTALPNANVYGYFNSSGLLDYSTTTDNSGIATLRLTEIQVNSSGTTYLTPHNVTVSFTSSSGVRTNSTILNISQFSYPQVNLSLTLDCVSPLASSSITSNTTFCPGTYTLSSSIRLENNSIVLNCDGTILSGYGDGKISVDGYNNTQIVGCTLGGFFYGIDARRGENITLIGLNLTDLTIGFNCYDFNGITMTNSRFSKGIGMTLDGCDGSLINNNTFTGADGALREGIRLYSSNNNIISNNTFSGDSSSVWDGIIFHSSSHNTISNNSFSGIFRAINFESAYPSINNTIYHNNFSASSYNIISLNDSSYVNNFNTLINISGTIQNRGNQYADYCDKGRDLTGDGYADNVSSAGANDWPYNASSSSKFSGTGADFAPLITTCPAAEVHLGSGGGSSSTTAAAAATTPAVTPTVTTTTTSKKTTPPSTELPADTYTPEEVKKFIKTTEITTSKISDDITAVTITLENIGTKKMYLFPELQQEIDDPYFIITRKTLGFGDSLLMKLSQIVSSGESISGRLLKAEIVNSKEITLNPGEKIDQVIEIKEGLAQSRQMKMQFTTNGVSVNEKEFQLEKKSVLGTAVDLDESKKTMDLYAVIVPSEKIGGIKSSSGITGAIIGTPIIGTGQYFLELEVIKENTDRTFNTRFNELYGPYNIKQTEPLIFAQQLKYGEMYAGKHIIRTKIYQGLQVVAENEFGVDMG
jgi:parallel beta-helix repeat protein